MVRNQKPEQAHYPLSRWVGLFFHFAMGVNKNFYWAWDQFMIVVRRQKKKTLLVLEIPIKQAPYLVQKHVDITDIPNEMVVASLMFLYRHYPSSPWLARNREHSVRFLSFRSFLEMLLSQDTRLSKTSGGSINRLLVAYFLQTLDHNHILPVPSPPQQQTFSIPQILSSRKPK